LTIEHPGALAGTHFVVGVWALKMKNDPRPATTSTTIKTTTAVAVLSPSCREDPLQPSLKLLLMLFTIDPV